MVEKLSTPNWENFSETEQNYIQELIQISRRAKELTYLLLNVKDTSEPEENELADKKIAMSSFNVPMAELDIISHEPNAETEWLDTISPEMELLLTRLIETRDTLTALRNNCQKACNDQFSQDPKKRKECHKICNQRLRFLAQNMNLPRLV
ncbi:hypothetical protein [Coleofasciculus sp. G2-EDA-02]|uniref:hypothetical protein n=1 Tax=Coleofasciculus sp. G2-EDA-02 TaxID=3069529 RepID=UPI0032F5652B